MIKLFRSEVPTEMSNLVEEKSPSAPATTIAVAARGKKDSKLALRWALENFISARRRIIFKILHVEAEFLVIEADDVVAAISAEVAKSGISKLVLGSSPRNALSRKFIENEATTTALDWEPYFCFVYFVSKGKLSIARTASLPINKVAEFDKDWPSVSFNSFSGYASAAQTGWSNAVLAKPQFQALSLVYQRYRALLTVNQYNNSGVASAIDMTHSRASQIHDEGAFSSNVSAHDEVHEENNGASDKKICKASNHSGASSQSSLSDGPTGSSFSNNEISGELKKLRVELHRVQEMFKMAEEKSDTSGKTSEFSSHKNELGSVSTEEEKARELTKHEKKKREAAEEEAEFVKECLEREFIQKKEAVVMASHEAKEKHKLENACAHLDHQFEKFGWE